MKRYMIIGIVNGEQFAKFTDSYSEAENMRMNIECGLGGYAGIHELIKTEDTEDAPGVSEYKFLCD